MTSFTWKKLQVTRMSTYGNSYNRIIFDKDGNVVALQPLLPEATNTNIDPNTGRVWYSTTINGSIMNFIMKRFSILKIYHQTELLDRHLYRLFVRMQVLMLLQLNLLRSFIRMVEHLLA